MRVSAASGITNCVLEAPNFGRYSALVETVGYGMSVVASEGITRNNKTFYPFARTSGSWYIEAVSSTLAGRNSLSGWILAYIVKSSDQYAQPLLPITVTIAKEDFVKVGYVTSNVAFGDKHGTGIYRTIVQFSSASDPTMAWREGTNYRPPVRDSEAAHFYPAGRQDTSLPPPRPEIVSVNDSDNPFDGPSGGYCPWPEENEGFTTAVGGIFGYGN